MLRILLCEAWWGRLVLTDGGKCIPCDLVFTSIGYGGVAIEGLPFDVKTGVIPNVAGRVDGMDCVYVAGWIKRGPSGTIGSNRACALDTVAAIEEDVKDYNIAESHVSNEVNIVELLETRNVKLVNFVDWQKIDDAECQAGEKLGKPREKFTSSAEMIKLLGHC